MMNSDIAIPPSWWDRMVNSWSLSRHFALVGGSIMIVVTAVAGLIISSIVSQIAIERTAASTALLIESLIAPLVQTLATDPRLESASASRIKDAISAAPFQRRFPHLDIWEKEGRIVFSNAPNIVGQRFQISPELASAFDGNVTARYTDLTAHEHIVRGFRDKFLELYIPVRDSLTGQIIAVAEIHEIPELLDRELRHVQTICWIAVGAASTLIMLSLFSVVFRGSRLIEGQKLELCTRLAEIERISGQNVSLRERIQDASGRLSEITESYMRRIGAELHDGPAQLISFANLRIEHVRRAGTLEQRERELRTIETVLAESLDSIRTMSRGLILPGIEALPLSEVISRVVHNHEHRTGTSVVVRCDIDTSDFTHAVKICVYRFLQEGLNNAFWHAGGVDQVVYCDYSGNELTVAVRDGGVEGAPGSSGSSPGFGLIGLRERVESLGGTFRIAQEPCGGMRIEMTLSIARKSRND